MSDNATPITPHSPRDNGRFVKGGPGGPGRPRGSVNRGDPAMTRAVVLTLLKLGRLERRVALLEGELKRRERAAGPKRRFGDGFRRGIRRLFGGRHAPRSQLSKASAVSESFRVAHKP